MDKLIDLFAVYLKHKTGAKVGYFLEQSEAHPSKSVKLSTKNARNASKKLHKRSTFDKSGKVF